MAEARITSAPTADWRAQKSPLTARLSASVPPAVKTTALGRVRELESEVASLLPLAGRYEEVVGSTTWRLMWVALGPYRQARARLGR